MVSSGLEKLEQSHQVDIHWHSYELRPKNGPPLSEAYRQQVLAKRPHVYATAKEQYGLEMNPGPFGIDSRPALAGVKYAESQGKGNAFHDAALKAYWEEARDIEDRDVLVEIAVQVGLDRTEFQASIDDPAFISQVEYDIQLAQAYGLQGVPALIFAEKYLVPGAVPYETLVQVVEQVKSKE